jgi:hypothetical protein
MDLSKLFSDLLSFIGGQVGASSLRLGPLPTLGVLAVLLVLLSLVARPSTRWMVRDLGRLAGIRRAMALAAEAGGEAVLSLGTAGLARGVAAGERLQTLAAMPILGHVARAAARAGVPLRVVANDPVAAQLAEAALTDAHRVTDTQERRSRSRAEYLGEGRAVAAAWAMSEAAHPAASLVGGGLGEEAMLLLDGAADGAAWTSFGTASPSQVAAVLLSGEGTLVGPELFQATSDLRTTGHERTGVLAANRLLLGAVAVVMVASVVALSTGIDLAGILAGR